MTAVEPRFVLPRLIVAVACFVWGLIHFQRHFADKRTSGPESRCPARHGHRWWTIAVHIVLIRMIAQCSVIL